MRNIITMLSFETHSKEIQNIRDIINRNIFYGALFIKADKSLRPVNGRKVKYVSTSSADELRGKWDRKEHNILTVFDRNKQQTDSKGNPLFYLDEKTQEKKPLMNAPISIKLDRLLFFKAGSFERDFTKENIDAINVAGITPEQLDAERRRMKMDFNSKEAQTPLTIVNPETIESGMSIQEVIMEEIKNMLKI